jgi:hypothetical protein
MCAKHNTMVYRLEVQGRRLSAMISVLSADMRMLAACE